MTEYENSKWMCEKNLLEAAHCIRNMEEHIDKVYKVSMYLIQKYHDELQKEFEADIISEDEYIKQMSFGGVSAKDFGKSLYDYYVEQTVFEKIAENMKKRYPDPWYCYGLSYQNK